jgi:hypothetical protein
MKTLQMVITTAGRKKAVVPVNYYNSITSLVIGILEKEEETLLVSLITKVEEAFQKEFRGNISWYLLYVKQDLEARRIIRVQRDQNHHQSIRLKKRYKERLEQLNQEIATFFG